MANRNGEPPPVTIQLTDIQRDRVAMARASLADSVNDEMGEHSLEHQATLEYRLESLLDVIDELTGGAERDVALCRRCGEAIHRPLADGRWFSTSRLEVLEDPCDHEPGLAGGAS